MRWPSWILLTKGEVFMTAQTINQLGAMFAKDVVAWGYAALGIALVASAVLWIMRLIGTR